LLLLLKCRILQYAQRLSCRRMCPHPPWRCCDLHSILLLTSWHLQLTTVALANNRRVASRPAGVLLKSWRDLAPGFVVELNINALACRPGIEVPRHTKCVYNLRRRPAQSRSSAHLTTRMWVASRISTRKLGKVDCNTHDDLRSAHNILRRWPRFQLSDVTLPAWIKTLSPHGIPSREAIGTPDWPNATRTHEALTNTIMESCTAAYGSPAIWSYRFESGRHIADR
jgi:hypothetical protein